MITSIKFHRLKAGITQKELGKLLGLKQSTVSMWEMGKRSPRTDALPKLALILGCSIDELLKDSNKKTEESSCKN